MRTDRTHGATRWIAWMIAVRRGRRADASPLPWTGGFKVSIAGLRFSSHSWERPGSSSPAGAARSFWLGSRRGLLSRCRAPCARAGLVRIRRIARGEAAMLDARAGIGFGTFASGGADSYGYVGQARLLAHGRLTDTIPRQPRLPVARRRIHADAAGVHQGAIARRDRAAISSGAAASACAAFGRFRTGDLLLVPVFGVLADLDHATASESSCGDRARRRAGRAVLLALSPTFLYQVVQPMSDVPCAACWLCGTVVGRHAERGAGAAGAGALCVARHSDPAESRAASALVFVLAFAAGRCARCAARCVFVAALVPGLVLLGWIQHVRYGSPVGIGIRGRHDVFSVGYILPNLARYPRWITESHTPFIWLSLLAPFWIARMREATALLAWTAAGVSLAVWIAYFSVSSSSSRTSGSTRASCCPPSRS